MILFLNLKYKFDIKFPDLYVILFFVTDSIYEATMIQSDNLSDPNYISYSTENELSFRRTISELPNPHTLNQINFQYILPNEIWEKIFSYCDLKSLMNISTVCKVWNFISWRSLSCLDFRQNKDMYNCIIESNLHKLSNIRILNLPNDITIDIEKIVTLTTLQSLTISWKNLRNTESIQVLSNLTNLVDISLSIEFSKKPERLTFLRSMTNLNNLKIEVMKIKTLDYLSEHIDHLKHLRTVDLSWCRRISVKLLKSLSRLENLVSLRFDMCFELRDKDIQIISSIKTLESLSFRWCQRLTDRSIEYLSNLPLLSSLNICYCPHITPQGLSILSSRCKITNNLQSKNRSFKNKFLFGKNYNRND